MPKKRIIVVLIVIVLAAVIGVGLFITRKAYSLIIDIYKPSDAQNRCSFYLRVALANQSFVPISSYKIFANGKSLVGMILDHYVIPLRLPASEPTMVLKKMPLVEMFKRLQIDDPTNLTFEVEVIDTLGRRSIISRTITLEKEVLDEIKGCAPYITR